jgi:HD superfamily phosphohydrolase YqeK
MFTDEISLIRDIAVIDLVRGALEMAPPAFFTAPASSTGRYHPACSNAHGGLVVHTQRAVYLGVRICHAWGVEERDVVIAALILHDIAKTVNYKDHPLIAEKYIPEGAHRAAIVECIKHHMGLWTPENVRKPIREYTLPELAVYTADYLSSRKHITTPKDTLCTKSI